MFAAAATVTAAELSQLIKLIFVLNFSPLASHMPFM
jgi:hypothetical protein